MREKNLPGSTVYVENFEKAMDDDFNTADSISAVFEFVKYMNTTTDGSKFQRISAEPV